VTRLALGLLHPFCCACWCCSATLPPAALQITRKPGRILLKRNELTLEDIKQFMS
jgi:hypothetical protein